MTQLRIVPTYTQAWTPGSKNDSTWYRYFQANETGEPPALESVIAVGASTFSFTAPRKGFVIIQGGTVSLVQFNRSGTNIATGATNGLFPVAQNDILRVTYSGKPVMTFVPT
jgi:hypothetical protein